MRKGKILLPIMIVAIGGFSVFYITQTLEQKDVAPEESEASVRRYNVGVNYRPADSVANEFLNDWDRWKETVRTDLGNIRSEGFTAVRLLLVVQHYGDEYMEWGEGGRQVFFQNLGNEKDEFSPSTPFAPPEQWQLNNLKSYLKLVRDHGLDFEIVVVLADHNGDYYSHDEDDNHYMDWFNAVFPIVKQYEPLYFYISGDTNPAHNGQHARWHRRIWPWITQQCSVDDCKIGIELFSLDASLWDRAVDGIRWIKANLSPLPAQVGVQFYPTDKGWLCWHGYVKGYSRNMCSSLKNSDNITILWDQLVEDYIAPIKQAAGSELNILIDEVNVSSISDQFQTSQLRFSEDDQKDFLYTVITSLEDQTDYFFIWMYYDDPVLDPNSVEPGFGLRFVDGEKKEALHMLEDLLMSRVGTTTVIPNGNTTSILNADSTTTVISQTKDQDYEADSLCDRIDINRNGIDIVDFAVFAKWYGTRSCIATSCDRFDANDDGMLDQLDLQIFISCL